MSGTDVFTIWLTDDDDAEGTEAGENAGDTNSAGHNTPAGESNDRDYADDKVNGRCDLLDFFPVLVDLNMVDGWENFTWNIKSTGDANVNVVFTSLDEHYAGSFYTQNVTALDRETPLHEAATVSLADEVALPEDFLNKEHGKGVLLIEGSGLGEGNIVLEGIRDGSDSVIFSLPVNVANVEDMYRTINLRQGGSSKLTEPVARKDADSDGRQFVFVHGFNVNHDMARGVASDFYKKLWQSGSDSMFTAVEWESDESMVEIFGHSLSVNYYVNVENAFAAAQDFKNQCDLLPGRKYLVGHSLGNMLICSAIQDFGLDYEKYFMLNAAIAAEAFDKNAFDSGMVDDYWENNIPASERASHWYENFGQDSDFRSALTWKDRFENAKNNVINLYSPSDEFLANCPDDVNREAETDEIIKTFNSKLYTKKPEYNGYMKYDGYWAYTEKLKGTNHISVINGLLQNIYEVESLMNCEGGWGVNENYISGDSSLSNTRFTPFIDERMAYEEEPFISSSEAFPLRAQLLADAIPAESYAAGSNQVSTLTNINLESYIGENWDWPSYIEDEDSGNRENIWKHNDATEIAYYHTYKLYGYIFHEHSYAWDNEAGTNGVHTLACVNTVGCCDEPTKTEDCTFVNGFCSVCGAKETAKYIVRSWDGDNQKITETPIDIPMGATTLTSTTTVWETGWYMADGTVDLSSARVGGNVNLILMDGCKLTVGGIVVTGSDSLTIYAQAGGTGELISIASANNYAGIGGGSKDDGGIITIHGGKITATGGNMAAGIGGGFQGACGDVVIYGGEVTAAGGFNGAGIGTGSAPRNTGGSIAIYGGKVTVSTSDNSAMGDQRPRAIGGGFNGSVDTITIGSIMEVSDGSGNPVTLNNTWAETLIGSFYTFLSQPVVEYLYYDEAQQKFVTGECDDYTLVTPDTKAWTEGWYVVNEDVEIDGNVAISGDVKLILRDGKTLTVDGAIIGDSTFSVYAQSDGTGMGSLIAVSIQSNSLNSIFIHGGSVTTTEYLISEDNLTINGGSVIAEGCAIAISHNITICGGVVSATGASNGIYSGGIIDIMGGVVSASGGAIAIGSKGDIYINDTIVSATGNYFGIYSENIVSIDGGDVTAQGGERAVKYGNLSIDESMTVYNQSNERVPRPVEQMWENLLTGTYYRIVHKDSAAPYRYYDEASKTLKMGLCCDFISVNNYTTVLADGKWYYADSSYENSLFMPILTGDVHLIIADNAILTWKGLSGSGHLYLHSQSTGSNAGQLICKGSNGYCGLAVTALTVDGVSVTATGSNGNKGNGSNPSGGCGVDGISATTITVNGGTVSATGGTGGEGFDGAQYNSGSGGAGGSGISVTVLTVNGGSVIATGGNGGKGGTGGRGSYGGVGGKGISATALTVNGGSVTTTGANGGWGGDSLGYDDGSPAGGAGGSGGIGISTVDLTVNDGIITTTGGTGGKGGKSAYGDGADGANGASVKFDESVTGVEATVKANEADEFICLPSGKSISDYQFAKITKTYETPLKIRSASLHISEDINVIYAAEVPEGCTDPYMVFTLNDRTYTVDTYTLNSKGQYCFELAAVTPQCMGDNISATLYATVDGCTASVTKAEYSVRTYCTNLLAKTDDELLITLLSDLLTYGAAAQTYTGYKTDALVTDGLDLSPSTFAELSGLKEEFVGTADPDTFWKSASLTLRNNVDMNLCFVTDSIEGLSVVLEINGRTETVTDFTPVDGEENLYQITFHGILATEFDLPVSASFYRNGAQVGNTLNYSVNTYICSKQNDSNAALATMVQALYNYGATANTYYFERYLVQ